MKFGLNKLKLGYHVDMSFYTGHVFLIGRHLNGLLFYIDPHCVISITITMNVSYTVNMDTSLLLYSVAKLSQSNIDSIVKYTQDLRNGI